MMASTVWKKEFQVGQLAGRTVFKAPACSEILTVARQGVGETCCVWYRCCPDMPLVDRELIVVGTGDKLATPDKAQARYVSSVLFFGGSLVLHFFEPEGQ